MVYASEQDLRVGIQTGGQQRLQAQVGPQRVSGLREPTREKRLTLRGCGGASTSAWVQWIDPGGSSIQARDFVDYAVPRVGAETATEVPPDIDAVVVVGRMGVVINW